MYLDALIISAMIAFVVAAAYAPWGVGSRAGSGAGLITGAVAMCCFIGFGFYFAGAHARCIESLGAEQCAGAAAAGGLFALYSWGVTAIAGVSTLAYYVARARNSR